VVDRKPFIRAYLAVPFVERKQFDIFWITFEYLMSHLARLFVNGTFLLKAKATTASFSLISLSTRFLPFVRLNLPLFPGIFTGRGSVFSMI